MKETIRMTRLTGFGIITGTDGIVTQETVFTDVSQNKTVTKVYTNRDSITEKRVTDYPDSALPSVIILWDRLSLSYARSKIRMATRGRKRPNIPTVRKQGRRKPKQQRAKQPVTDMTNTAGLPAYGEMPPIL